MYVKMPSELLKKRLYRVVIRLDRWIPETLEDIAREILHDTDRFVSCIPNNIIEFELGAEVNPDDVVFYETKLYFSSESRELGIVIKKDIKKKWA
jgi:hypothetical protein